MFKLFLLLSLPLFIHCLTQWPDHDISTLKLLQIIHRHGDRTPLPNGFATKDPFKKLKYWPEGYGQLTLQGKYRLWQLGRNLRFWYDDFFKKKVTSPKNIYVRSSIEHRCIESAACLLAGLYPPKKQWQWATAFPDKVNPHEEAKLGNSWQAFPIETFMPKANDTVLVPEKKCPLLDMEKKKSLQKAEVKKILDDHKEFIKVNVTPWYGKEIKSIADGNKLHDTLTIEKNRGYLWPNMTLDNLNYILDKLKVFRDWDFIVPSEEPLVNKLRGGILLNELVKNMNESMSNRIETSTTRRFFEYSAHDTTVSVLMHALGIYNRQPAPRYAATVILELHKKQNSTEHFVKIYYAADTNKPDVPIQKFVKLCTGQKTCSFNTFFDSIKEKITTQDEFDKLCQSKDAFNDMNLSKSKDFIHINKKVQL